MTLFFLLGSALIPCVFSCLFSTNVCVCPKKTDSCSFAKFVMFVRCWHSQMQWTSWREVWIGRPEVTKQIRCNLMVVWWQLGLPKISVVSLGNPSVFQWFFSIVGTVLIEAVGGKIRLEVLLLFYWWGDGLVHEAKEMYGTKWKQIPATDMSTCFFHDLVCIFRQKMVGFFFKRFLMVSWLSSGAKTSATRMILNSRMTLEAKDV